MDLEHFYEQLNKIDDKLDIMSTVLTKNTVILEEHAKRSDRSEARLEILETEHKKFRGFISISTWIIGTIAAIAAFIKVVAGLPR